MFQDMIQNKMFIRLVFVVLVCGAIALGSYARLAYLQANTFGAAQTISVVGTAETFLKPDLAEFTLTVSSQENDPTIAQNKSAEKSNTIKAYLKEKGVEEKDIKTESYTFGPKYEWVNAVCVAGINCPPGKNTLVGYTANETVTVKVRKMEQAGDLIAGVGERGATDISNLSFTIDDTDAAKEGVRKEAIEDAREKAKVLAESLGVRLGALQGFYDNQGGGPVPMYAEASISAAPKMMDMRGGAPELSPGENKISSSVTLVYKIH